MNDLARTVEALLFLSAEPVPVERLADACEVSEGEIVEALARRSTATGSADRNRSASTVRASSFTPSPR